MINEIKNIDANEYVKLFKKKFNNFMFKSPSKLEVIYTPTSLILKDLCFNNVKTFEFDYMKDVCNFINEIKQWLLDNVYPIMIEVKTEKVEYTSDQIKEMINKNINVDELLLIKEKKIEIPYRLERILLYSNMKIFKKDRIFVRNLKTNVESLYELELPGSVFLKGILEKWNSEYAFKVFKEKSRFLNDIDINYNKLENDNL